MSFTQLRKATRTISVKDEVVRKTPKPKPHRCEWPGCRSSFSRKPDMVRHLRTVHQGRKDFVCRWPGCEKRFAQQATLSTHENVHTGEKPWLCPANGCSRAFGDQSSCARHYREQHTGMTHYCPHCPSTNKRLTEFRNHLLRAHNVPKTKEIDVELYKLPESMTVDDLAVLPQFNVDGMNGIEMRRRMPGRGRGSRNTYSAGSSAEPAHALSHYPGLISMTRTPSNDSLSTTPSLSSASISPCPRTLNVGLDGFPVETSHVAYGVPMHGNYLGVDFGTENGSVPPPYRPVDLSPELSSMSADNMNQYPAPRDAGTHAQLMHAQPYGWEKAFVDPKLLQASGISTGCGAYDYEGFTFRTAPIQQNSMFQVGWNHPNYRAPVPVPQLRRSSYAQEAAWAGMN